MQHFDPLSQAAGAQGMSKNLTQLLNDGWLLWLLAVWLLLLLALPQGFQIISCTTAKRLQEWSNLSKESTDSMYSVHKAA